jgi:dihydrofolate reductase
LLFAWRCRLKSTYYAATSLDGYIADEAGGVDWLDEVKIDKTSTGYDEFYSKIDGLMMGRSTYDFIFDYGSWPYDDLPCWICSSRELEVLPGCNKMEALDLQQAYSDAESTGVKNLWVIGGGKLVSSLIQAGLLTHIQVSVMPIVLGAGIRLVDSMPHPVQLEQEWGRTESGFCEIMYRVDA